MSSLLNDKILKIIPLIFLLVIIAKIVYTYNDTKTREYEYAKQEAKLLYEYAAANRNYHRQLFINNVLPLNSNTLQVLPAFSSRTISEDFSNRNQLDITVKTVSDNARNIMNTANDDELKAIKYFRENNTETEYFSNDNDEFYQYANVLKVDKTCLRCHGAKSSAPQIIQDNYESAYDYKLGEVRGIFSIKIPTEHLSKYFLEIFFYSIAYDILLFIFLFLGIYFLVGKSKKINKFLSSKVAEKTQELKNSFLFERLTLLPNRLKLMQDIMLKSDSKSMHLALVNIDSFKDINDLYGYDIGDSIIKELANKIKSICENNSGVYKLPTDEYAIFTTEDISQGDFLLQLQEMVNKIEESKFEVNDNSVFITLSCGVVSNEKDMMSRADAALQNAKKDKKSIVVYDSTINSKEKISKNMAGISLLKDAIKEDRITPYFQPIYNTHTQKIEKYESLARIVLADGEVIPPFAFLDIAIKSKLYPEITKAMIRKSFEYFRDKDYEFSINISMHDIQNKKTLQYITDMLKDFNEPNRVVFEILESDKVEKYEEIRNFIINVKRHGCKIAIDDFGSGYSNFAHIHELNADYLKIDSSLVKFITTDENSRIIVKTIINFASSLGLKTIAEFVEDKDSLDLLEKMGVDFIQGYYIGKPAPELSSDYN